MYKYMYWQNLPLYTSKLWINSQSWVENSALFQSLGLFTVHTLHDYQTISMIHSNTLSREYSRDKRYLLQLNLKQWIDVDDWNCTVFQTQKNTVACKLISWQNLFPKIENFFLARTVALKILYNSDSVLVLCTISSWYPLSAITISTSSNSCFIRLLKTVKSCVPQWKGPCPQTSFL